MGNYFNKNRNMSEQSPKEQANTGVAQPKEPVHDSRADSVVGENVPVEQKAEKIALESDTKEAPDTSDRPETTKDIVAEKQTETPIDVEPQPPDVPPTPDTQATDAPKEPIEQPKAEGSTNKISPQGGPLTQESSGLKIETEQTQNPELSETMEIKKADPVPVTLSEQQDTSDVASEGPEMHEKQSGIQRSEISEHDGTSVKRDEVESVKVPQSSELSIADEKADSNIVVKTDEATSDLPANLSPQVPEAEKDLSIPAASEQDSAILVEPAATSTEKPPDAHETTSTTAAEVDRVQLADSEASAEVSESIRADLEEALDTKESEIPSAQSVVQPSDTVATAGKEDHPVDAPADVDQKKEPLPLKQEETPEALEEVAADSAGQSTDDQREQKEESPNILPSPPTSDQEREGATLKDDHHEVSSRDSPLPVVEESRDLTEKEESSTIVNEKTNEGVSSNEDQQEFHAQESQAPVKEDPEQAMHPTVQENENDAVTPKEEQTDEFVQDSPVSPKKESAEAIPAVPSFVPEPDKTEDLSRQQILAQDSSESGKEHPGEIVETEINLVQDVKEVSTETPTTEDQHEISVQGSAAFVKEFEEVQPTEPSPIQVPETTIQQTQPGAGPTNEQMPTVEDQTTIRETPEKTPKDTEESPAPQASQIIVEGASLVADVNPESTISEVSQMEAVQAPPSTQDVSQTVEPDLILSAEEENTEGVVQTVDSPLQPAGSETPIASNAVAGNEPVADDLSPPDATPGEPGDSSSKMEETEQPVASVAVTEPTNEEQSSQLSRGVEQVETATDAEEKDVQADSNETKSSAIASQLDEALSKAEPEVQENKDAEPTPAVEEPPKQEEAKPEEPAPEQAPEPAAEPEPAAAEETQEPAAEASADAGGAEGGEAGDA